MMSRSSTRIRTVALAASSALLVTLLVIPAPTGPAAAQACAGGAAVLQLTVVDATGAPTGASVRVGDCEPAPPVLEVDPTDVGSYLAVSGSIGSYADGKFYRYDERGSALASVSFHADGSGTVRSVLLIEVTDLGEPGDRVRAGLLLTMADGTNSGGEAQAFPTAIEYAVMLALI